MRTLFVSFLPESAEIYPTKYNIWHIAPMDLNQKCYCQNSTFFSLNLFWFQHEFVDYISISLIHIILKNYPFVFKKKSDDEILLKNNHFVNESTILLQWCGRPQRNSQQKRNFLHNLPHTRFYKSIRTRAMNFSAISF